MASVASPLRGYDTFAGKITAAAAASQGSSLPTAAVTNVARTYTVVLAEKLRACHIGCAFH